MMKRHSGLIEPGTPTPRPWQLTRTKWGYHIVHGSRVLAAIGGKTQDPGAPWAKDPQACADATLMHAAPDLLAACEEIWAEVHDYEQGGLITNETLGRLRAAMAKARGEREAHDA
jgi:hypothetical protein